MKKLLAGFMICLTVFSFVGCGSSSNEDVTPDEVIIETESKNSEATPNTSFEEIVVAENENYSFKIKGTEINETWGTWDIKVFLENKTDEPMMFSWDNVSVNGYMIDPFWASEVAAGKKENTSISFNEDEFLENEIQTVEDVSFNLNIYNENPETWEVTQEHLNDIFTVSFK